MGSTPVIENSEANFSNGRKAEAPARAVAEFTDIFCSIGVRHSRLRFNPRHCPRTRAPSGRKNCPERTGLLVGTERQWSHCGGAPKPTKCTPPAPSLVRGFGVVAARKRPLQPTRDPNHVSQETAIKQDLPDGFKAHLGSCDAPQQTQRPSYCNHNGGNGLAGPLGPRLFDSGGARKKLGLTLVSEKTGDERVYRVVASDISPKRKSRGRKVA